MPFGRGGHYCRECDRTFRRQVDWYRHMKIHYFPKPFRCTACDRQFVKQESLDRHWLIHERQYKGIFKDKPRHNQTCINCESAGHRCSERLPCDRCWDERLYCRFPSDNEHGSVSQAPRAFARMEEMATEQNTSDASMTSQVLADSHNSPQTSNPSDPTAEPEMQWADSDPEQSSPDVKMESDYDVDHSIGSFASSHLSDTSRSPVSDLRVARDEEMEISAEYPGALEEPSCNDQPHTRVAPQATIHACTCGRSIVRMRSKTL